MKTKVSFSIIMLMFLCALLGAQEEIQVRLVGPFFNHLPSEVGLELSESDTLIQKLSIGNIDLKTKEYALFLGDAEIQEVKINGKQYYAGKYQSTEKLARKWDYRHMVIPSEVLKGATLEVKCHNLTKIDFRFTPVLFPAHKLDQGLAHLIQKSKPGIIFTIIFLGSILIFLIYSIGMTIQTKNPDFRFYGYYLAAILIHNVVQADAYLKIYLLFPRNPIWYHHINEFLQMFIYAFFIMFIKVFLELKTRKRRMLRLVDGSIFATFIFGFVFLFTNIITKDFGFSQDYLSVLWLLVAALGVIIVIGVNRNSDNPVRHYIMIGSIFLLVGSILELYTSLILEGGYNWNLFAMPSGGWNPFNYTQLAIMGEIVCFALGIGKKIRLRDQHMSELQKRQILDLKSKEEFQAIERALLQKELDALRSQMNPHFLFNSMTSVNDYIMKEDPQKASKYLTKFAKLMRAILNNSRKTDISLREELETLNLYIELEQMRSSRDFKYVEHIDPSIELDSTMIPTMVVQPYVENAIKHGLAMKENGELKVQISKEEQQLKIVVEDNGVGRQATAKLQQNGRISHGMNITHDRIGLLNKIYGVNASVFIEDKMDGEQAKGTKVEIKMNSIKNR